MPLCNNIQSDSCFSGKGTAGQVQPHRRLLNYNRSALPLHLWMCMLVLRLCDNMHIQKLVLLPIKMKEIGKGEGGQVAKHMMSSI